MDSVKTVGTNESVLDLGRSLYKLHFQLLLLLESANKMFTALCSTAQDNQVSIISYGNHVTVSIVNFGFVLYQLISL